MAHIIILDENGNEIGRLPDDPGVGGGLTVKEDHPPRILTLQLGLIAELMKPFLLGDKKHQVRHKT